MGKSTERLTHSLCGCHIGSVIALLRVASYHGTMAHGFTIRHPSAVSHCHRILHLPHAYHPAADSPVSVVNPFASPAAALLLAADYPPAGRVIAMDAPMRRAQRLCDHLSLSHSSQHARLSLNHTAQPVHPPSDSASIPATSSSINPTLPTPSPASPVSSSPTSPSPSSASSSSSSPSSAPHPDSASIPNRHWNGWGFRDTEFTLTSSGDIALAGHRYAYSGRVMPHLRSWMEAKTGIDVKEASMSQHEPVAPKAVVNEAFLRAVVAGSCHHIDTSDRDRIFHAHGHTAQEVYTLRFGTFARVPDVVVYPSTVDHVQSIMRLASEHNVCVIPYGGGTSVTQSLICPSDESRTIASLDMHLLCAVTHIDRSNMTARIQAGAIGKAIEATLNSHGLTLGHEPDSMEFSSMGGWVATRASGMRKNRYGNIEDIVQRIQLVRADGAIIEKAINAPRVSVGPDLHHIMLGSEGTLGVVTEVTVRIAQRPECTVYGSVVFPSFQHGVNACREIQRQHITPTSFRLVDNNQFQFGQALKPANDTVSPIADFSADMQERLKRWYVTRHLKFDVNSMVAATIVFEGTKSEVAEQQRRVYAACAQYGGIKAGADNGIRGYFLTYMIAYLRDFGFNYKFIAESFETSVAWSNVAQLCEQTKTTIYTTAKQLGITKQPFVSCRVTQLYDTGCCVYFYFGFVWTGLTDPVHTFETIEQKARDTVLLCGGSLSHHHGIGKLRKSWMVQSIGDSGMELLKMMKQGMDPKNVLGSRNLIDV